MRALTVILFLFLIIPVTQAQKAFDKLVQKAEESYREGDYSKATKHNEKLRKKSSQKLGSSNPYLPVYYMNAARLQMAQGLMADFDKTLTDALTQSKIIYGEPSREHGEILLSAARLMINYGNFVKANQFNDEARDMLEGNGLMDDDLKAGLDLNYAHIYSGKGFYNEALRFIGQIEDYYRGRAVKERVVTDDNGSISTERLSQDEIFERFDSYAELLNLRAITLHRQGDIRAADNAYIKAQNWIEDNLSKNGMAYVENLYHLANLLVDGGIETNQPVKMYEDALRYLDRDHDLSHEMAMKLYEKLLKIYLYNGNRTKYKNDRNEYERVIKRYFTKNSIHNINLETITFDRKLARSSGNRVEAALSVILSSHFALPENHPKRIELLEFAYLVSLNTRNFTNSETYLTQAAEIKKVLYGEESPEYHLSRVKLANFYLNYTNRINDAIEIYEESYYGVVEPEIKFGHVDYVDIQNQLAQYYVESDDYAKASDVLNTALNAVREKYDDQDPDYAVELDKIASLQIRIGQYENAEENITTALEILEDERRDSERVIFLISALETQAQLNAIFGEYEEAEDNLRRSQKLWRRADENIIYDELSTVDELASLNIALGNYSTTEKILLEAQEEKISMYGSESPRLITTWNDLARLKLITGDYTEAERLARKADEVAEKVYGQSSTKLAPSLTLLSEIYTTIGDYEKAEENIELALEIQQSRFGDGHIDVARSLSQLALIKFYKGDDRQEIEDIFTRANQIIIGKLGDTSPAYAQTLVQLAVLYIEQERWDRAFGALTKAASIWEVRLESSTNVNIANIYSLEGDIHYQRRDYDKAVDSYDKSMSIYRSLFNRDHPDYVKVLSKLSKVHYMLGDMKSSRKTIEEAIGSYNGFIKQYFPALSEREKAKFWNTIRPEFEFFNTLAFSTIEDDPKVIEEVYNNALNSKALLLNSSIKIRERILNSGDVELIAEYNEWLDKKEQLTAALSMGVEQLEENEINTARLQEEVEQLEKEISAKSEDFASALEDKQITWEDVESVLKPNEVAVEMVRYRHFDHEFTDSIVYACLYLTSETRKTPEYFLIRNGHDLENRYFKYYRSAIEFEIPDENSYEQFWKPISEAVGTTSTLYLSADGVYNQINLEAIPTYDGNYVLDNSNIILVSNTKDLYLRSIRPDKEKPHNDATMFGNPTFYASAEGSGRIGQLPGTEEEINKLDKMLQNRGWSTDEYLEQSAKEDVVKELNSPKVFHIATHGFFTSDEALESDMNNVTMSEAQAVQNPLLRSGLLLTGAGDILDQTTFNYNIESGILTAYEAMNLNLDQTDLVVLSACETGLGDVQAGEGVFGLQRAFLVAGAKTLIMSIFKVNDAATQTLMTNFYQKWLETGKKRESFVEAKKELRMNPEFASPKYWGAFLMLGLD